jgi:hypothetical protein
VPAESIRTETTTPRLAPPWGIESRTSADQALREELILVCRVLELRTAPVVRFLLGGLAHCCRRCRPRAAMFGARKIILHEVLRIWLRRFPQTAIQSRARRCRISPLQSSSRLGPGDQFPLLPRVPASATLPWNPKRYTRRSGRRCSKENSSRRALEARWLGAGLWHCPSCQASLKPCRLPTAGFPFRRRENGKTAWLEKITGSHSGQAQAPDTSCSRQKRMRAALLPMRYTRGGLARLPSKKTKTGNGCPPRRTVTAGFEGGRQHAGEALHLHSPSQDLTQRSQRRHTANAILRQDGPPKAF